MLKTHKPENELRRIEVDTKSPLGPVASYADEILGDIRERTTLELFRKLEVEGVIPSSLTSFLQVDLVKSNLFH